MVTYFEDFPEEVPGNDVHGRLDPKGAEAEREAKRRQQEKLLKDQLALDAKIAEIKKEYKIR